MKRYNEFLKLWIMYYREVLKLSARKQRNGNNLVIHSKLFKDVVFSSDDDTYNSYKKAKKEAREIVKDEYNRTPEDK